MGRFEVAPGRMAGYDDAEVLCSRTQRSEGEAGGAWVHLPGALCLSPTCDITQKATYLHVAQMMVEFVTLCVDWKTLYGL